MQSGTVGEIIIDNPSRNVIPGDLKFTIDIRSPEAATLDKLHSGLQAAIEEISKRRKVTIDLNQVWRKEPTIFDSKLVAAVENASKELGYLQSPHHFGRRTRRLQSGDCHAGGHDFRAVQGWHQP